MDGRRLRWVLAGGLLIGGIGCGRNTNPPGFAPTTPTMFSKAPAGGAPQPVAAAPGAAPPPGVAVEVAPPRKPGQKLGPDAEVAFAETHIQVALGDPTPPNKDELLDMARHRYERALKQDPKHKGALLGLARMHTRLGEREKSAAAYKRYADAYPKEGDACNEAALACGRFHDWDGAVRWCEAALRLDPENRTYRKTMGFCLARAGRWEEAFGAMCRVMPEAQARYNMAKVLEHVGQPDASRVQLQLALQADPAHAASREFLAELDQAAQPAPGANPNAAIQTVGGTAP